MHTHTHTHLRRSFSRFDPETAVPSRRDGQVEAFSACLAAQAALQESLLGFMRGASNQVNSARACAQAVVTVAITDPLLRR